MPGQWKIGGPGSGRGAGQFPKEEHEGHLLACVGVEERPDTKTPFGEQDAAFCHYLVCLDDNTVLADFLMFGTAIVPALLEKSAEVDIVIARLGKGQPKPGQSPPWLLFDPTPEDYELAEKWFDRHAVRMPSGSMVIETPPPPGANDPF